MSSEVASSIICTLCLDVCAGFWNDFVSIRHMCFDRLCSWRDFEEDNDEAGPSGEREPLIAKPVAVQPIPTSTMQDSVVANGGGVAS
ncbi:hypothetical protein OBBRIDRAFT_797738 [Obba rivulosa]|uniref:Uncharacterized protein n=1 Tax=Obba rivulosa TaxID=1052685 RepID=A0A8E2ASF6_9APHY|nr:hypothetical protein OBBRIDRAFT_797738 [Obba rivulosa]